MESVGPARQTPGQAQLALMVLSAVVWGLFGFHVVIFAGSTLAELGQAVIPSSAPFWVPWWDMDHPLSGVYMSVMLAIASAALWRYLRFKGVERAALPIGKLTAAILGSVVAAVLIDQFVWETISLVTTSLGADDTLLGERDDYTYALTPAHLPGEIFWTVFTAPVFEEMTFRGLLLGCLLARGWHPGLAVTVTAAAFASTHGQYYLPGLLSVFTAGLLFGWLRLASRGLAAPLLAHMTLNAWAVYQDWAGLAQA